MPFRQLILGGSFNPIHHGHLICSRAAAEEAGFDGVLLMPSSQPPHKLHAGAAHPLPADAPASLLDGMAPAPDRLRMCQLAIAGSELFEVSDLELTRAGPSFTLDTARELRRRGWGEVAWLIGADMLRTLPTWHRAAELLNEVHFIPMARPGWSFDWESLPAAYHALRQRIVEVPQIDIQATHLRHRLAAGQGIEYFSPPPVCQYIREKGLYRQ